MLFLASTALRAETNEAEGAITAAAIAAALESPEHDEVAERREFDTQTAKIVQLRGPRLAGSIWVTIRISVEIHFNLSEAGLKPPQLRQRGIRRQCACSQKCQVAAKASSLARFPGPKKGCSNERRKPGTVPGVDSSASP
jgi:hypothetical protein